MVAPLANWMLKRFDFRIVMMIGGLPFRVIPPSALVQVTGRRENIGIQLMVIRIGVAGVVLGQCLAGICRNFAEFLVCQGVLFGLGLGFVSRL